MGFFNTSNVAAILLLSLSAVVMSFPVEAEQGRDLSAAVEKVEAFIDNEVEKRLSDPAIFDSDKECMIMCKEVYQNTVESLKTRIKSVSAPAFDVSAFTTNNIETCNDCFDSYQKFEEWAEGLRSDFLANINYKYVN